MQRLLRFSGSIQARSLPESRDLWSEKQCVVGFRGLFLHGIELTQPLLDVPVHAQRQGLAYGDYAPHDPRQPGRPG